MAERYDVLIRIKSVPGTCPQEHQVGEEYILDHKTPDGICLSAFNSLFPDARVLAFGGTLPWQKDPDVTKVVCPDPECPVVFELRRLRHYEEKAKP